MCKYKVRRDNGPGYKCTIGMSFNCEECPVRGTGETWVSKYVFDRKRGTGNSSVPGESDDRQRVSCNDPQSLYNRRIEERRGSDEW